MGILEIGQVVVIDYTLIPDGDVSDWMFEEGNCSGHATISSVEKDKVFVKGCDYPIEKEYILVQNQNKKWERAKPFKKNNK